VAYILTRPTPFSSPRTACIECGVTDESVHIFFYTNEHVCDSCRSTSSLFSICYKTKALKEWKLRPKDLAPLRRQACVLPGEGYARRGGCGGEDGDDSFVIRAELFYWRDLKWARAKRVLEEREVVRAREEKKENAEIKKREKEDKKKDKEIEKVKKEELKKQREVMKKEMESENEEAEKKDGMGE